MSQDDQPLLSAIETLAREARLRLVSPSAEPPAQRSATERTLNPSNPASAHAASGVQPATTK